MRLLMQSVFATPSRHASQRSTALSKTVLVSTLLFVGLMLPAASILHAAPVEQQAEAVLMPFLDLLASPPSREARACRLRCRVESMGDAKFAPENAPSFELSFQPPEKLLLKVRFGDSDYAACRIGQKAWVTPASAVNTLLGGQSSSKNKEFPPMQIPLSGKQLGILPVLLEVQDKGTSPLEGTSCRVLDVRLRPEIGNLLPQEAGAWSVRMWLNPEGKPVRAGVRLPKNSMVLRIDHMEFSKDLPTTVWNQPEDAKSVTPGDFEKAASSLLHGAK